MIGKMGKLISGNGLNPIKKYGKSAGFQTTKSALNQEFKTCHSAFSYLSISLA